MHQHRTKGMKTWARVKVPRAAIWFTSFSCVSMYAQMHPCAIAHMKQANQVAVPDWARVLVEAQGGPLVFAGETGGRRVAVLTFDLHDSDLPLQVAFPVLMSNLLNYLAPAQPFSAPDGLRWSVIRSGFPNGRCSRCGQASRC